MSIRNIYRGTGLPCFSAERRDEEDGRRVPEGIYSRRRSRSLCRRDPVRPPINYFCLRRTRLNVLGRAPAHVFPARCGHARDRRSGLILCTYRWFRLFTVSYRSVCENT